MIHVLILIDKKKQNTWWTYEPRILQPLWDDFCWLLSFPDVTKPGQLCWFSLSSVVWLRRHPRAAPESRPGWSNLLMYSRYKMKEKITCQHLWFFFVYAKLKDSPEKKKKNRFVVGSACHQISTAYRFVLKYCCRSVLNVHPPWASHLTLVASKTSVKSWQRVNMKTWKLHLGGKFQLFKTCHLTEFRSSKSLSRLGTVTFTLAEHSAVCVLDEMKRTWIAHETPKSSPSRILHFFIAALFIHHKACQIVLIDAVHQLGADKSTRLALQGGYVRKGYRSPGILPGGKVPFSATWCP